MLSYLTDRAGTVPFLLVSDEFPYLTAAAPALTSILQVQWDHHWQETGGLPGHLADAQVHYSIIEAIAHGERTWQGITKRVGREGGSLSRAVHWLMGMGLLERVVPISDQRPSKSKRALYRISDPYLASWHRFVSPMVSTGMIGLVPGSRLWTHQVAPRLDDHMGPVFEAVCRAFVKKTEALPFKPLRVGEWWDASSTNEVDVVAIGPKGELLLGECKWGVVSLPDLRRLQSRTDLILRELSGVRQVHHAVFSGRGVADGVQAEVDSGQVLHFRMADLYERNGEEKDPPGP